MKFRLKITLCMLCILSVMFGIGGSILIMTSFHTNLSRERQEGYHAYQMVLGTLQVTYRANEQVSQEELSKLLAQMVEQKESSWTGIRFYTEDTIVYEYGMTAFDVPQTPAAIGTCVIQSLEPEEGEYLLALSGTMQIGENLFFMDMVRDVSSLYETRQQQQLIYLVVFFFMALLCAFLSYTLAKVLTGPLVKLSEASQHIASGNLSCRANVHSKDEIGLLASDFNKMADALEEKIFQLKEAMERQERFMGSFSHEMRTPMTSIIGYGDLLRSQVLTEEEQIEAANYIVEEGKRLQNLSRKLLDILVIKNGTPTFVKTEPASLIAKVGEQMKQQYAKQGIALTWECETGECLLDPDLIMSLVINLVENARKAMDKEQGEIHVQLSMINQEEKRVFALDDTKDMKERMMSKEDKIEENIIIEETTANLHSGCKLMIQDNGRGIPEGSLKHLTEAFYRVDKSRSRAQGGVGLGLALCEEIVALHNGTILFESKLGQGTKVTVTIGGVNQHEV